MGDMLWPLLIESSEDMHKYLNEFEFPSDPAHDYGVICHCTSEKSVYNLVAFIFDWIFFILADYEDNHTVSTEFEFWPVPTTDC